MPTRRRLSEHQLVSSLRKESGDEAAKTASMLLAFSRENNLLIRRRHASVSIRMALGPSDRPATLFVVPESDRFYTYWLDHWPRRYRRVASRYATDLRHLFPGKRVIAPQGTRHNTVRLGDVASRMRVVQRAIVHAVQRIRAINAAAAGALAESLVGLEGQARQRMVLHRKREGRLRDGRIAFVKNRTGALACEVRGCGFNFHAVYGKLGEDYAQVHHMLPLSRRTVPSKTRVSDLRVVCANCHAMIHLGGKSRSLAQIASALRAAASH